MVRIEDLTRIVLEKDLLYWTDNCLSWLCPHAQAQSGAEAGVRVPGRACHCRSSNCFNWYICMYYIILTILIVRLHYFFIMAENRMWCHYHHQSLCLKFWERKGSFPLWWFRLSGNWEWGSTALGGPGPTPSVWLVGIQPRVCSINSGKTAISSCISLSSVPRHTPALPPPAYYPENFPTSINLYYLFLKLPTWENSVSIPVVSLEWSSKWE